MTEIASEQWGLITRAQASKAGVPARTFARLAEEKALLKRVGYGTYQLAGAPVPNHVELRAAWLQLAPATPAWRRTPRQGVISHRSAAALYGLGHLPADRHEFTVETRRQSRRPEVRLHKGRVVARDWSWFQGLPVTRPSRTIFDLLREREEPDAIAAVLSDALRSGHVSPDEVVAVLAPSAMRLGFRRGDGYAVLRSLLELVPSPDVEHWLGAARERSAGDQVQRRSHKSR